MAAAPIQLRFGGYGPPTTTHSRGLKFIGDKLERQFPGDVEVKYVWNIMDLGYLGKDTLWLAEHGILTMVYQSTSYLTDRVPELGFADLPFLFGTNEEARAAMDGALGAYLTRKTEERISYRVMGYFENGFRHISNRLRPIRTPGDMAGMKIRVLPSRIHARTFELLGAEPRRIDLTEAIRGVADGTLDAQENPFANTVTYGVPEFHPYHTESAHFYLSRGLFANRDAVDGLPDDIRSAFRAAVAEAIPFQRDLAVEEELSARKKIEEAGGEVIRLSDQERRAFRDAVAPLHDEVRQELGDEVFNLLP